MPHDDYGTIIFDLDGTLVDSVPDLADSLDQLMAERGLPPFGLQGTRDLIGHGIPALVAGAFRERGTPLDPDELAEATARFVETYSGCLTASTRPYAGALEAIQALRRDGWRLVVCTNKREAAARAILADLDLLPCFALVAGPDTFGVAKPDPAHLWRTLPEGRPQGYPVAVVGDSAVDVAAARAAGLPVVAVAWGYSRIPVAELAADAVAREFHEVPELVTRIALI